ncbi:MAG: ribokinase [Propioniciclava sp.]
MSLRKRATGRVVTFGSANEDLVYRVDRMPLTGETLLATTFSRGFGGKGANQAIAAARSGAQSSLVGAVGSDDTGQRVVANLSRHRVDASQVHRSLDLPTGHACVMIDANGFNQIIVMAGANSDVPHSIIERAATELSSDDVAVIQCEIPAEQVAFAVLTAAHAGVQVLLNLAPFMPLPADVLAAATLVVVNETEADELAIWLGCSHPRHEPDPEALARTLATAVGTDCLITLGEAGSVYCSAGCAPIKVPASRVDTVVDTTGAGDVYVGTLAAELAQASEITTAMTAAAAAAAASVRTPGAQFPPQFREEPPPFHPSPTIR